MQKSKYISDELLAKQLEYTEKVRNIVESLSSSENRKITAYVQTLGCQQNESDSEKLKGMLFNMGYSFTDNEKEADIILINTCAVRENAELKVFGSIGALKHLKLDNPSLIIGICGCMVQQEQITADIKKKYPHVDMVFGTHALYRLPELLFEVLTDKQRVFDIHDEDGHLVEGLPKMRDSKVKAWLPVMSGCNNFCSYCIVPYVRGRERSRQPQDIIEEASMLIKSGYKDITLLGQNVNSYGKDEDIDIDFSELLKRINAIPGDFRIRFMTSHPKDASHKLVDTIASCEKVCNSLHLPFQSGNDKILKLMNRHYTRDEYLALIKYAKEKINGLVLTSDVIVGFPGESYEEFLDTVDLVKKVEFDSLFTFIYSKRKGTPAEKMEDSLPKSEKMKHFNMLLDVQNEISRRINNSYIGKTVRVLCEGESETDKSVLSGRTEGNKLVNFTGNRESINDFCNVKITDVTTWSLRGEQI